jgi:anti-anti-sigma factor
MHDASVAELATPQATPTGRFTRLTRTPFTVDTAFVGRRAVLSVAGEIDMATAPGLQRAVESAAGRAFEVWLDLTATTFMDSSGIHVLSRARARLTEANGRLAVICPNGPVRRVLDLTGLEQLLEIHSSRRAAHDATT